MCIYDHCYVSLTYLFWEILLHLLWLPTLHSAAVACSGFYAPWIIERKRKEIIYEWTINIRNNNLRLRTSKKNRQIQYVWTSPWNSQWWWIRFYIFAASSSFYLFRCVTFFFNHARQVRKSKWRKRTNTSLYFFFLLWLTLIIIKNKKINKKMRCIFIMGVEEELEMLLASGVFFSVLFDNFFFQNILRL